MEECNNLRGISQSTTFVGVTPGDGFRLTLLLLLLIRTRGLASTFSSDIVFIPAEAAGGGGLVAASSGEFGLEGKKGESVLSGSSYTVANVGKPFATSVMGFVFERVLTLDLGDDTGDSSIFTPLLNTRDDPDSTEDSRNGEGVERGGFPFMMLLERSCGGSFSLDAEGRRLRGRVEGGGEAEGRGEREALSLRR